MSKITVKTVNQLLEEARFRDSFKVLPKGNTFKNLSTVIVIATPGNIQEKKFLNCDKCQHKNEYVSETIMGLNPVVVESWKKLIKPMNVPIIEMIVSGHEVGVAYNKSVEFILGNPALKDFKFMLTIEHDNIIPFIPGTQGPMMMLYESIEKGFDAVGGLYWTKGVPSMPLVYGDPKETRTDSAGFFKVRHDWKPNDLVECNGMGMGFTLFKLDIFRDKRIEKPWFQTVNKHSEKGIEMYTQDLFFFEKLRALNYRVAVDTRVRLGHMNLATGEIF